jgi:type I restriction enzyme S subunit
LSQFNALPEGWLEIVLEDISFRITKGTTPTSLGFEYTEEGILFVKVESLVDGKINHENCAFINDEANQALARSQLQEKGNRP